MLSLSMLSLLLELVVSHISKQDSGKTPYNGEVYIERMLFPRGWLQGGGWVVGDVAHQIS